jgi:peptidoglycan hydrolase-like protein with peptidoglycan-binding domain
MEVSDVKALEMRPRETGRIDWAEWRPLGAPTDEPPITPRVLIFHTMVGFLRGTEAVFRVNGYQGTESTFGLGGPWDGNLDGALWQWQDMNRQADAQFAGNAYANSVETSDGGDPTNPWSPKQLEALIRLTVDWCRLTGNPCELVRAPGDRGLGYHELFHAWNLDGHVCPGPVREGQLRTTVIPKARKQLGDAVTAPAPTTHLAEDGILGPATIAAMQRALHVDDDGVLGPVTRAALQHRLGVPVDGIVGPATIRALQRLLGVQQIGRWDHGTTRALQQALNHGVFSAVAA